MLPQQQRHPAASPLQNAVATALRLEHTSELRQRLHRQGMKNRAFLSEGIAHLVM